MKRTLALLLLVILSVCSFASCGDLTLADLEASYEEMSVAPHTATMNFSMTTDNADLSEMISKMKFTTVLTINGDATKLKINVGDEYIGTLTFVDNCLYVESEDEKLKATATKEQFEEIYDKTLTSMGLTDDISSAMFNQTAMTKNEDGTYTVTYTDIKPEEFQKLIGEEGDPSMFSNVVLTLQFDKKGVFQSAKMTYTMSVEMGGESAAVVTVSSTTVYTYTDVSVTAPADAASYTETDINDLMGE